ncbi:MAG: efflux RND transporter permease subunit [Pirellulales bacterium]
MWIVKLALRRPYTFVVMAMMIAIMGVVSVRRMPTDIFPEIDIPVVAVIWTYTGISPDEMETRVVGNYERVLVSTVNGIEHIESQSLNGIAVVKIFLQEGANLDSAISQVVATSQQVLRSMPPGIFPPLVMRYNAANVPIVQVSLGSESLSEQQLFDYATTGLRPGMATVPGAADSLSVRRESSPDHGRYRPGKAACMEALGGRYIGGGQCAEFDRAVRYREDR